MIHIHMLWEILSVILLTKEVKHLQQSYMIFMRINERNMQVFSTVGRISPFCGSDIFWLVFLFFVFLQSTMNQLFIRSFREV